MNKAKYLADLEVAGLREGFKDTVSSLIKAKEEARIAREALRELQFTREKEARNLILTGKVNALDPVTNKSSKDYREMQVAKILNGLDAKILEEEKELEKRMYFVQTEELQLSMLRNLNRSIIAELNFLVEGE